MKSGLILSSYHGSSALMYYFFCDYVTPTNKSNKQASKYGKYNKINPLQELYSKNVKRPISEGRATASSSVEGGFPLVTFLDPYIVKPPSNV